MLQGKAGSFACPEREAAPHDRVTDLQLNGRREQQDVGAPPTDDAAIDEMEQRGDEAILGTRRVFTVHHYLAVDTGRLPE